MRITRAEVTVREAFIRSLFEKDPGLTAAAANEKFAAKFRGQKMRSHRVYAIRAQVRAQKQPQLPGTGTGSPTPLQLGVAIPAPANAPAVNTDVPVPETAA